MSFKLKIQIFGYLTRIAKIGQEALSILCIDSKCDLFMNNLEIIISSFLRQFFDQCRVEIKTIMKCKNLKLRL